MFLYFLVLSLGLLGDYGLLLLLLYVLDTDPWYAWWVTQTAYGATFQHARWRLGLVESRA